MIYLDPTALMKLIDEAPESAALTAYLSAHTDTRWITCALSRVELLRAVAALPKEATGHAHHVLAGLGSSASSTPPWRSTRAPHAPSTHCTSPRP